MLLIPKSEELLIRSVDPAHRVSSITENSTFGEVLTLMVLKAVSKSHALLTAKETSKVPVSKNVCVGE